MNESYGIPEVSDLHVDCRFSRLIHQSRDFDVFHPYLRPLYVNNGVNTVAGGDGRFFSTLGRYNSGSGGNAAVVDRNQQRQKPDDTKGDLIAAQSNGIFSRFRHTPLFAQISLVMALGLGAFWLFPIGFDRLFPLNTGGPNNSYRQRLIGAGLSLLGLGCLSVLLAIILTV
jgi:hypothetical protein